jgi:hypothetical protein
MKKSGSKQQRDKYKLILIEKETGKKFWRIIIKQELT